MVRPLSVLARAAALIGLLASSALAEPTATNSFDELRQCLTVATTSGKPVECVVDEPIRVTSTGTGVLTVVSSITMPTTVRYDATVRFTQTGCLHWDHLSGEPNNTTSALRVLDFVVGTGTKAGSRFRLVDPCFREFRAGVEGGNATTSVRVFRVTGTGHPNVTAELIGGGRIVRSSTGTNSADTIGFTRSGAVQGSQPPTPRFVDSQGMVFEQFAPATTKFGYGVTWNGAGSANGGFDAETHFGSGVAGHEPDNLMGPFYNLTGPGGTRVNPWEHAMECSHELTYRSTGGTSDETWMEENCDYYPAEFTATLTSPSGAFQYADIITFENGGTGFVVSYNAPTLTFRQNWATSENGEVVTNVTRAGSGTLSNLTPVFANFRPFSFVWRTLTNTAAFEFYTGYGVSPNVSISAGFLRMNGNIVVSGSGSAVYGPALWAISNGGTFDTGTEVCVKNGFTCQSVINFAGLGVSPTSVACGTSITSTQTFLAMCK